MIEHGDGLVVGADDALLARTNQSTRNLALARHRCLTALLETSRRRKWLGILHASAVGARSLRGLPRSLGLGKSTLAAALVAAGAVLVTDDYAPEQGSWYVLAGALCARDQARSWRLLRRYYPDLQRLQCIDFGLQIRCLELDAARMALHQPRAAGRGSGISALSDRRRVGAGPDHDGRGVCGPVPRQVDARSASRGACGDLAMDRIGAGLPAHLWRSRSGSGLGSVAPGRRE